MPLGRAKVMPGSQPRVGKTWLSAAICHVESLLPDILKSSGPFSGDSFYIIENVRPLIECYTSLDNPAKDKIYSSHKLGHHSC